MRRIVFRSLLFTIGGIILIFLVAVLSLWVLSPGKAEPITDENGDVLSGSISEIEKIELGGQEQFLIIRGEDTKKPVMLFLHGGPGSPEISFMKKFNTAIEKDFVMVYWEQRGAGKSFSENIASESMNLNQFISDTKELSEYLAQRFNKDKIYVMGHSWGSLLGILTAHQHPELFHAYFGVGQVANQYKGEQVSFEWVKAEADKREDADAIKTLSEMKFPDSLASSKEWMDFLLVEREYVMKYGGAMSGIDNMMPMVKMVLKSKEYTMGDKVNYMRGNLYSIENLWQDVIEANLFEKIDSMQVPVYIFQGVNDYQTPYSVAKEFYDQLKAPKKEFFTFENSAHSPLMAEAEKFNGLVREISLEDF